MKTTRPRSPSHAAKNKTPEDRVWEFGCVLGERNGRLLCRPCNLALDHTRRSTIVEHLRSRKHQRFLDEVGLLESPAATAPPVPASLTGHTTIFAPAVIYVDGGDDTSRQDASEQPSSPSQGPQELVGPYLLKKESHCTTVLDQLLRDDTYTDVTLTAEGHSLRAHRIVLCLASPYFRQVLSREMNVQSVVLLRDVKFAELKNIINFIYTGEATVDATELESFMRTAEMLEISSLCEGRSASPAAGPSRPEAGAGRRARVSPSPTSRSWSGPRGRGGFLVADAVQVDSALGRRPVLAVLLGRAPRQPAGAHQGGAPRRHLDADGAAGRRDAKSRDAEPDGGADGGGRERRESSGSIGGFASIAGLQKEASAARGRGGRAGDLPRHDGGHDGGGGGRGGGGGGGDGPAGRMRRRRAGRCPYCPHLTQKFEGVPMMRHLLVSHPCKPAFPCDSCWRVFVKRASFKSHQQKCQAQAV
nr:sex determination protein fruitless-like [Penaeus vannamei]